MWLIVALIGHIGNAFVLISDKAFVQKLLPDPQALAFISGASGIFTFVLIPWFLVPAPLVVIAAGIFSGILFITGLVIFFTALRQDEVSRVVPAMGSMIPLFTFGLSVGILGEVLAGKFLWAFILLSIGGLLIAFRSFADIFSRLVLARFLLEILAAFLFASAAVFQKYAFNGTEDISAFLWSRIGAAAAAVPLIGYTSVRRRIADFTRTAVGKPEVGVFYVSSQIMSGLIPLITTAAIALGNVSLVNALQGVQYVILFILAIFFSRRWPQIFAEKVSRKIFLQKSIATVLIATGLALLV